MEFLSNINLAKQTRMTDLRNTVIRRIAHLTNIALDSVPKVYRYDFSEMASNKAFKSPSKDDYYFFVNNSDDCKTEEQLIKISKGKKETIFSDDSYDLKSWNKNIVNSTACYVVLAEDATLLKKYVHGRKNNYNSRTNCQVPVKDTKKSLAVRLSDYKAKKILNSCSYEDLMKKVSNAYAEIAKNFMKPSPEFMDKITNKYNFSSSVLSFATTLPQYLDDFVLIKKEFDGLKSINLKANTVPYKITLSEYNKRFISLYQVVCKF